MKYSLLTSAICIAALFSCQLATTISPKKKDLVCGKEISPVVAFSKTYKGSTYYFDTYACKLVFAHKPERFIHHPGSGKGKKYERAKF